MQKIVLYEFASSGGLWRLSGEETNIGDSIIREGRAMLTALASDFATISGVELIVLRDSRWVDWRFDRCCICDVSSAAEEESLLRELSNHATATILIAPEFDGILHERCRWIEDSGGKLLGPSSEVVKIAANKQRTAEHLAARGVRVPRGIVLAQGDSLPKEFRYPAVLKPIDGCGSQDVRLIESCLGHGHNMFSAEERVTCRRLEEFVPGTAASVAVLCGPNKIFPLAPCRQRLSENGRFQYLGGSLPLPAELAKRAQNLAVRTITTLPQSRGYLGIDIVLGDDPSGSQDTVIEINPRLTTSYIGLRAAAQCNLAEAMWAIATGQPAEVSFGNELIEFDSDGIVRKFRVSC